MKKAFSILIMTLCLLAVPMGVSAQTLVFHLTGGAKSIVALPATFTVTPTGDKLVIDGGGSFVELAKDDVMCVTYRGKKGDVNEDETVDVADIATIIDIMAGKGGDDQPATDKAPKDAVAVDLGLPSGTKWANMNVGAERPEDYGMFFAWGEATGYNSVGEGEPDLYGRYTMTDRSFEWANYEWCSGSHNTMTKYCSISSYGTVDNKTTLELSDDAARTNWGGQWVMPTYEDMVELYDNTTNEWMTVNGVNGRRFTSKINGNSIFLPAGGDRYYSELIRQGARGGCWSSSLHPSDSNNARSLTFDSGDAYTQFSNRFLGKSVRPVLRK